ncbi:Ribose 5-phosphate isomerase A [hydrothermal vent metagenome]|uniref:ribose-5-phosphate isomerase n=1 Tax=hydrothermal vent metagenome TaxID=652676 RepID=A0A3B0RF52_9ZZZZ
MANKAKQQAARAAFSYVENGMTLGLGSGSTAEIFIEMLGLAVAEGLQVRGVPTSKRSAEVAQEAGVALLDVEQADHFHLTVDGADEVGPEFALIKGGGGCLLREKIIANASDLMICIVDESKLVEVLGAYPLPVEVDRFGYTITAKKIFDVLAGAGCQSPAINLRNNKDGKPFITDGGNYIFDCACDSISRVRQMAARLSAVPGVVEHGIFLDLARIVIVGTEEGADILEL